MTKCKFCSNDHCLYIAQPLQDGIIYVVCRSCGAEVTWNLNNKEKTKKMYGDCDADDS